MPRAHSTRLVLLSLCLTLCLSCTGAPADAGLIHHEKSQFNDNIYVRDTDDGIRLLTFEEYGATQSAMRIDKPNDLVLPYTQGAMAGLAIVPQPQRILVIGLGGASMPKFLRQAYPDAYIDCVELDPAVADVAKRFFAFSEDARMKVHIGDGRKYIETAPTRYDIIFLDAYGADSVPYSLATIEFLNAVRDRLTEQGVAVANVWSPRLNKLYHSMVRTYREAFPELHLLAVPSSANQIFLALPRKAGLSKDQLVRQARELRPQPVRDLDLPTLIDSGYLGNTSPPSDARTLRDADTPREE